MGIRENGAFPAKRNLWGEQHKVALAYTTIPDILEAPYRKTILETAQRKPPHHKNEHGCSMYRVSQKANDSKTHNFSFTLLIYNIHNKF